MKTIKKVLSVMLSVALLATLCLSAMPMSVSAETTYPVTIAALDGTEHNIVHPGGSADVNRLVNSTSRDWAWDTIHIQRNTAGLPNIDISAADYLTFKFTVSSEGESGVWEKYKERMVIRFDETECSGGNYYDIADADVEAAFADVAVGTTYKIKVSLDSISDDVLRDIHMVSFKFPGSDSIADIAVQISDIKAELAPTDPILFANLPNNTADWSMVNPGFTGVTSAEADAAVSNIRNRPLNFTEDAASNIYSYVNVARSRKGMAAIDLTLYDNFTFNITVADNGAWDFYKDYITVSLGGQTFSRAETDRAFANLVPGQPSSIRLDLDDINRAALGAVDSVSINVNGSKCDYNLIITVEKMYGGLDTYDEVILLDDEKGETAPFMGSPDTNMAKVGNYSYVNHTDASTIIQSGFYGGALFETPKDISAVTANGTKGAVRFWFWVKDADTLKNIQDQYAAQAPWFNDMVYFGDGKDNNGNAITNVGAYGPDDIKYGFGWTSWTTQLTQVGWNEVILPFDSVAFRNDDIDWTNICTLRFRLSSGVSNVEVALDDFKVSSDIHYSVAAAAAEDTVLLDDENDTFGKSGEHNFGYIVDTADISRVGNKALKHIPGSFTEDDNNDGTANGAQILNEGWTVMSGFYGADPLNMNISATTNNGTGGTLRFWIYIKNNGVLNALLGAENAAATKSFVKIGNYAYGDANVPDNNFRRWSGWVKQVKKVGWNEVILDFANSELAGTPDYKNITSFEIRFPQCATERGALSTSGIDFEANPFYFDDIRISADNAPTIYYGDANEDGVRDIRDLVNIKVAKANNSPIKRVYDICYDGLFDANDIKDIRKAILGIIK